MSRAISCPLFAVVAMLSAAAPLYADWFFFGPSNGGFVLLGQFPEPGTDIVTVCDGSPACTTEFDDGATCDQCHVGTKPQPVPNLVARHLREFLPRIEVPVTRPTAFAGGTLLREGSTLIWRTGGTTVRFPTGTRFVRTREGRQFVVHQGRQPPSPR